MKNTVLKFGLISGGIIAVLMILSIVVLGDSISLGTAEVLGYLSMVLAFSVIFVAIKQFKDKVAGGELKFGKAFLIGLYITLICSAIYVATWMIVTAMNPDIMERMAEMYKEKIMNSGGTEADIQTKLAEFDQGLEYYANPAIKAGITFFEIFPIGVLVSLLSAFILRTKKAA